MMDIKKIINLFRKTEGYISLNAEYANKIADVLEKYERRTENLIHHNADLNNQLNIAESHIEKLAKQLSEKQPEWISVEDRLPEEDGSYAVIYDGLKKVYVYYFELKSQGFNERITHWMPLPEPPKPKELTFKDVFLKAFPKAPLNKDSAPGVCIADVFPWGIPINCKGIRCNRCWNQPYFEEEGEADA